MDYARATLCARLCRDIYQDFDAIQFPDLPLATPVLINQPGTDTQCAILQEQPGGLAYIVFRGSDKRADWEINFNFFQMQFEFNQAIGRAIASNREQVYPYSGKSSSGARMHQGFTRAYLSVRSQIHDYFQSQSVNGVVVTGHSLGGALAKLCGVDVQYNFKDLVNTISVYTYGAPRVGNAGFRDSFNNRVPDSHRIVYGVDIVPNVPRFWQGYRHVSNEVHLGPSFRWDFLIRQFKDHDIVGYIKALAAFQN
jgi:predicted lipase